MGIGCIAVGCKKLRLISLRWCIGVSDLGVGLIAVKCKEIRSLDLSYLPVS
jgi:F-box/leucine-rich repeat protein 2/20